jgi:Glyoxalase/Bleomycin resistance protein/Dioxygenase superfamily
MEDGEQRGLPQAAAPDGGHQMAEGVRLGAAVVFVRQLGRSVSFYQDVLDLQVADSSSTASLLVNSDGQQLILREFGDNAARVLGGIGVQYLVWTTSSREDLDRRAELLRQRSAYRETRMEKGAVAVEGRDPDDLVLIMIYAAPGSWPVNDLPARIYAW